MRECLSFSVDEIAPCLNLLESCGIPRRGQLSVQAREILDSAVELFVQLADPKAIIAGVSIDQFQTVYSGKGLNSPKTPLQGIFTRSDGLALFAATVGSALSVKASELFAENEPARAFMLDAVASAGADCLATLMQDSFLEFLPDELRRTRNLRVLSYSPGYCGWHITGQEKIFQVLCPEEIGITLNASCLMQPLKSVSGVLVAADRHIHEFTPSFPFCKDCETWRCVERINSGESG